MSKHIDTMITAFRDGFQSFFGARVLTQDYLPAFEAAASAGLNHFEIGGGARFQSLYFYCNEDAFDMMDAMRSAAGPEANLQTLARGINVVGLDSQPRDIIDMHARLFQKHGVSTIRNFDALNDVNNLVYSGQRIVEAGANHEVCVTMMGLPPGVGGAHTPEFYVATLRGILDSGVPFHSVCFKDASGTSTPSTVFQTVKQARALLGEEARIVFHSHETAGLSISQYVSAIEAGANQVDCSLAPVSGGTAQPDLLTLWNALRGSEFDLGIDVEKIRDVERLFGECMKDYFFPPEALAVEPSIAFSPMPGGALTANTQMMLDNGIMDRYPEVIRAMGEVVARGGFGTSVTPVSQFYFQQAFNNVMFGPWQRIAEGYGKMVLGYFGRTPETPDPEIVAIAADALGLEPTERAPIDINDEDPSKGVEAAKVMLTEAGIGHTEESIFIAAACREKGIQFLKGEATVNVRKKEKEAEDEAPEATSTGESRGVYRVVVDGVSHKVQLLGDRAIVNGKPYSVDVSAETASTADQTPATAAEHRVCAPFPGIVLQIIADSGSVVEKGEDILVLESMKMETRIASPASGSVDSVQVKQGDQVKAGDLLAVISES